jgi:hypothetical protein
MPFDEALAGAATNIAIGISQGQGFDSADLTWACIRSGWPYTLSDMRSLRVAKDTDPIGLLADLNLKESSRIGLVRARAGNMDIWVLLQSEVLVHAAPFAKTQTIDTPLANPFSDESGVQTQLLSPGGTVYTLGKEQALDETGEWLMESHLKKEVVLRAALFVNMEEPMEALIPYQDPLQRADDPEANAVLLLSQMHQDYFDTDKGLRREPALDTSARLAMKAWLTDQRLPAAHLRFERLGYVREPRGEVLCTGETVRACLDNLYWSIPLRKVLLAEGHGVIGVAASRNENGEIMLMLNLAAD